MLLTTQNLLPLDFTQGDSAVLLLTATDDQGVPVNITGAAFVSQILGPNGEGATSFPNGQHAITNAALGQFSLSLAVTDTPNCGEGANKQIISQLTIGAVVQTYRGVNLLTVYPPTPIQ